MEVNQCIYLVLNFICDFVVCCLQTRRLFVFQKTFRIVLPLHSGLLTISSPGFVSHSVEPSKMNEKKNNLQGSLRHAETKVVKYFGRIN